MFFGDESHRLSGGRRFEDFDKLLILSAFERGDGRLSELGSYPQEPLPTLSGCEPFPRSAAAKPKFLGPKWHRYL
jgi:hypothetical protein